MKGKTILICIVTLLIFLSMPKAIAPPMPPCAFYGYVSVGGKPAQDGLSVTAVIRGTALKWTTETRGGTYGWPNKGSTELVILPDDPDTQEKEGGVTGNVIEFYIDEINTNQTATFESGSVEMVSLSIPEIPGQTNGEPEPTPNPYPLYAIPVAIGMGSAAVFLIYRRGYRIGISKKPKRKRL